MKQMKRAALFSIGLAVTATLGLGASASASVSGYRIDGTCYEDGSWFTSSNVRTMGGSTIQASFSSLPSKGLVFQVLDYNTGGQLGQVIYGPPTDTQTIYTEGRAGTEFVNMYRLQTNGHQDNYSFSGSEIY
jgi:hypothetical protein